jgi:hypothetical protein
VDAPWRLAGPSNSVEVLRVLVFMAGRAQRNAEVPVSPHPAQKQQRALLRPLGLDLMREPNYPDLGSGSSGMTKRWRSANAMLKRGNR